MTFKKSALVIASLALTLALASCQQGAPSAASAASDVVQAPAAASLAAGLTLSDARIRAPLNGKTVTAGYVSIANGDAADDQLLSISSPTFDRVELHTSTKGADGMMQMDKLDALLVPANGTAIMAPGGLHIMLFDPKAPIKTGDSVEMTLTFAKAGEKKTSFMVVDNPVKPAANGDGKGMADEHAGH